MASKTYNFRDIYFNLKAKILGLFSGNKQRN